MPWHTFYAYICTYLEILIHQIDCYVESIIYQLHLLINYIWIILFEITSLFVASKPTLQYKCLQGHGCRYLLKTRDTSTRTGYFRHHPLSEPPILTAVPAPVLQASSTECAMAMYILELSLLDSSFASFKPSLKAWEGASHGTTLTENWRRLKWNS